MPNRKGEKFLFTHAGSAENRIRLRADIAVSPVRTDVNEYLTGERLVEGIPFENLITLLQKKK